MTFFQERRVVKRWRIAVGVGLIAGIAGLGDRWWIPILAIFIGTFTIGGEEA